MKKREIKNHNIDVLDPEFKKYFEKILDKVNFSVSMLYDVATRDRKTKAYNYNFFDNVFKMEFEKARRGLQNLSFLIIDIDYFKKVNDTYGHIKGDEILEKLASVLMKSVRISDIVARFGGEEFVVLFPETNLKKAIEISARIREKIKKDSFLKKYKISVSGGLTEYLPRDTLKKIEERADKALYEAKDKGRDRLMSVGKDRKIKLINS